MDPFSPRRQWDADDIEAAELTAKEAGVDLLLSYASWREIEPRPRPPAKVPPAISFCFSSLGHV